MKAATFEGQSESKAPFSHLPQTASRIKTAPDAPWFTQDCLEATTSSIYLDSTSGCESRAIDDRAYSEVVHDLVRWDSMYDGSTNGAVRYGFHYIHVFDASCHDAISPLTPSHVVTVLVTDGRFVVCCTWVAEHFFSGF